MEADISVQPADITVQPADLSIEATTQSGQGLPAHPELLEQLLDSASGSWRGDEYYEASGSWRGDYYESSGEPYRELSGEPYLETGDQLYRESGDQLYRETGDQLYRGTGDELYRGTGDELYRGAGDELYREPSQDDLSFLFSPLESLELETNPDRDIYLGEDANTRMTHLMHSDTMIVVIALIVMIFLGLAFRSLCMRLTSKNSRKERVRGGLRALAEHMHTVTRSMSNDLEQQDSARAVMRTYSNYGKVRPRDEEPSEDATANTAKPAPVRQKSREDLRVQAFSNLLTKPGEVSIEMTDCVASPGQKKR